jgi:hypothetical protein
LVMMMMMMMMIMGGNNKMSKSDWCPLLLFSHDPSSHYWSNCRISTIYFFANLLLLPGHSPLEQSYTRWGWIYRVEATAMYSVHRITISWVVRKRQTIRKGGCKALSILRIGELVE